MITLGLDFGKSVFQIDADATITVRRKLRRAEELNVLEALEPRAG